MPHLTNLETNLKKELDVKFTPRTFVRAKNFGGKSSLRHAISLVLQGRVNIPEIGSMSNRLMQMAHAGAEELHVKVQISDGAKASISISGSPETAKKPVWDLPNGVAPTELGVLIDDDLMTMLLSDTKRRQGLLQLIDTAKLDPGAIIKSVPKAFQPAWVKILEEARPKAETSEYADVVIAAQALIKKKLTDAKKNAKVQTATALAAMEWSEEDEEGLTHLRKVVNSYVRVERTSFADREAAWQARVDAAVGVRQKYQDEIDTTEWLDEPAESDYTLRSRTEPLLGPALAVAKFNVDRKACAACGADLANHEVANGQVEKLRQAKTKLDVIDGRIKAYEKQAARREWLNSECARLDRALAEPAPTDDFETEERGGPSDEEKNSLLELERRKTAFEGAERAKREAIEATSKQQELEALQATCKFVVVEVLAKSCDSLAKSASKWLPFPNSKLVVRLHDGSKSTCNIDLTSNDEPHPRPFATLSRSEQWMVVAAMARAKAQRVKTSTKSGSVAPICALCIDEVDVTPSTLAAMLDVLGETAEDDPLDQIFVFKALDEEDRVEVPSTWSTLRL